MFNPCLRGKGGLISLITEKGGRIKILYSGNNRVHLGEWWKPSRVRGGRRPPFPSLYEETSSSLEKKGGKHRSVKKRGGGITFRRGGDQKTKEKRKGSHHRAAKRGEGRFLLLLGENGGPNLPIGEKPSTHPRLGKKIKNLNTLLEIAAAPEGKKGDAFTSGCRVHNEGKRKPTHILFKECTNRCPVEERRERGKGEIRNWFREWKNEGMTSSCS